MTKERLIKKYANRRLYDASISKHVTLEDIRDHFALLAPKIQDKLRDHLENMFLWRQLTSLSLDVCATVTLEDMTVNPLDEAQCAAMADEFELHALRRDMAALARMQYGSPAVQASPGPIDSGPASASAAEAAAPSRPAAQAHALRCLQPDNIKAMPGTSIPGAM